MDTSYLKYILSSLYVALSDITPADIPVDTGNLWRTFVTLFGLFWALTLDDPWMCFMCRFQSVYDANAPKTNPCQAVWPVSIKYIQTVSVHSTVQGRGWYQFSWFTSFLSFDSVEQSHNSRALKQHVVSFYWIALVPTPLVFIIVFRKLFDEMKQTHSLWPGCPHHFSLVHDLPAHSN